MKTPITPSDLRIGDRVRTESRDGRPFGTSPQILASEWIVGEDDLDGDFEGVDLYLLERRAPVVKLPSELTLGWATWRDGTVELDTWRLAPEADVIAFVEAVAVPKAALDELRGHIGFFATPESLRGRINAFLAAVDAANGGDPR